MTGREMLLIDENGAPAGERHVVFYNPPVVNAQLGIRAGSIPETRRIASSLLRAGVQSIVFARSRLTVEVLVRYLKDMVRDPLGPRPRPRLSRSFWARILLSSRASDTSATWQRGASA